jgi:hypothetical protein
MQVALGTVAARRTRRRDCHAATSPVSSSTNEPGSGGGVGDAGENVSAMLRVKNLPLSPMLSAMNERRDVKKLKALYVTSLPNPQAMHRVDVKKQVLVELDAPPLVGRARSDRARGRRLK